jgi:NAD(P)-dependent dehydrogenase (short-subunit alcohol dehydrogenase family)
MSVVAQPDTVLVTGANRGLGLEFVRQYVAAGWRVFAACRRPNGAKELQGVAAESGGRLRILEMDVTDSASVRAAAAELKGETIDLLINNAGVGGPPGQRLGGLDYDAWARVMDANTMGPMRVSEAFLENIAQSRQKRIVTITSGMGSIEDNTSGGRYAYRSSKAAVNMVIRSLAVDTAARGITCIVMNPGWVRTDMGGEGGKLSPEESIKAMRSVIATLKPEDTGKFLNFTGNAFPW